jgi:hypothetical protein
MTEEEQRGLIGLGNKVVGALPAGMLAVVLINALVVIGLFWHLESQLAARSAVLIELIKQCGH